MSRLHRTVFAVTVGVIACWLRSFRTASASECLYSALPRAALTYFVTGAADIRQALQLRLRPGLAIAVAALIIGAFVVSRTFGDRALSSWRFWVEIAAMLYFLAGVLIILLGGLRLLTVGMGLLVQRWPIAPSWRKVLSDGMALAIFAVFALPYGLAFSNVHRFKLPNLTDPQQALGREFEDIEFTSSDGTTLHGWWIPSKKPSERTVIFCHGLAANRAMSLGFAEAADWLDANLLMFDLRGHGDSAGRTVTLGYREKDDVLAAIAYVRRERPEQARKVIGMGTSLGAAAMACAAGEVEQPLAGVILDSGFASTLEMTHNVLDPYPSIFHDWFLMVGLPLANLHGGRPITEVCPAAAIPKLRAPVVILHMRGDPMTPSAHSVRFFELAAEPKRLHIFEGNGHCNGFADHHDQYRQAVMEMADWLR